MARLSIRYAVALACLATSVQVHAEGILDIEPYIGTNISYDDNLFRFASDAQADASGFSKADTLKTLQLGVDASLRLSRQLVTVSASLSENQYNNNTFLDNRGEQLNLRWNWQLGSKLYGEVSSNKQKSISGFDNNNERSRNNQEIDIKRVSVNWRFLSDWTIYGLVEKVEIDNDLASYQIFNRNDDAYEFGLRYTTSLGNVLGVFYRDSDSDYPSRDATLINVFGASTTFKQYGVNIVWRPSQKLRLTSRLSNVEFERIDAAQDGFEGFNQRYNLTYLFTAKTNLNMNLYKEASQVDDFAATYVEFEGADVNLGWGVTNKVTFTSGVSYVRREFLGNTLVFIPSQISDNTLSANVGLAYRPIDGALLQLSYSTADRKAKVDNNDFKFNNIQFLAQYQF